jgi:uncharacterized protein YcfJ
MSFSSWAFTRALLELRGNSLKSALSQSLETSMKKTVLFSAMGALAAWGSIASAQEFGRVISSTPVVQQVPVARQVCNNQPVAVQQPNSGGGAALGGIVGGVLGNQIGHGSGRAAATLLGALGGAVVGNNVEGNNAQLQNVAQCSTQTTYENRTVAYNVTYEYGGKQYQVQMANDPGQSIALQVTPAGTLAQGAADPGYEGQSGQAVGVIVGQPAPVAVYPSYPAYYPNYYYPPVGVSLGFGFYGGHRHWR